MGLTAADLAVCSAVFGMGAIYGVLVEVLVRWIKGW